MRDFHDCELCGRRYEAGTWAGRSWDGTIPCECGGSHRVCRRCVEKWDLTVENRWPLQPLKRCPDDVRLALDLMETP